MSDNIASPTAMAAEDGAVPQSPPPPPVPSMDPGLNPNVSTPPSIHTAPTPSVEALFKISPLSALKLLGNNVQTLVNMTGDVPPTPSSAAPTNTSHMSSMAQERAEIARSNSQMDLAGAARSQQQQQDGYFGVAPQSTETGPSTTSVEAPEPIDGVRLRQSSTATSSTAVGMIPTVVGANMQPLYLQHGAITRKFFSKKPPPISIDQYLMRLHRFCPMSTAVYLATSRYITRLALEERVIAVTPRSCHRLLLAGLRVAMKALEDHSYSHSKFAQVGGVSGPELARLEVSFCFLTGFELVAVEEELMQHWNSFKSDGSETCGAAAAPVLTLNPGRLRNEVTPAG